MAAAATATATATASFQCFFTNDETTSLSSSSSSSSSITCYPFELEANKKSSFLLEAPTSDFGLEKPAHLVVEAFASQSQSQRIPFVLGGFEIVTNSRNIEVYATDDEEEKETYITTCRGIKHNPDEDLWYKALLVIPGGPRSMKRLRLKLLSLRPTTSTKSLFSFMKLKGRLPDVETVAKGTAPAMTQSSPSFSATAAHSHAAPQYAPQPESAGLTASDMGAAMAGVSMMVRSTEERIRESLTNSMEQLGTAVGGRLQGVERIVMAQSKGLIDLQEVIVRQHDLLTQQSEMLTRLQRQQMELMETVQSLQGALESSATKTRAAVTNEEEHTVAVVENQPAERVQASSDAQDGDHDGSVATDTSSVEEEIISAVKDEDDEDKPYSRPRTADESDGAAADDNVDKATVQSDAKAVQEEFEDDTSSAVLGEGDTPSESPVIEDDKPHSRPRAQEVEDDVQGEEKRAEDPLMSAVHDTADMIESAVAASANEEDGETTATAADPPMIPLEEPQQESATCISAEDDQSPDRSRSELKQSPSEDESILEPPDKSCVIDTRVSSNEDVHTEDEASPPEVDLIDFS